MNKRDVRLEAERALEYYFYGTEKGSSHRDGKKETVWKNDCERSNQQDLVADWNKEQEGI